MTYRGIIFDFNGVLLWDIPWHRQAWEKLAQSLGRRSFTDGEWRKSEGVSTKDLLQQMEGADMDPKKLAQAEARKDELYRDIASRSMLTLSPGAECLLEELARRTIPRAIATSSSPRDMQYFIEKLGLLQWFSQQHIVVNDGTFPGKPAPHIYLRAAEAIGVPIEECLVVEDSEVGIRAAVAAGAGKVIGLGPTSRHIALRTLGAHDTITSLQEINREEFA